MIKLDVLKSADRSYVFWGISNKIRYSIMITNLGDEKVTGVTIKDVISKGAYFIPGSFSVNGYCQNICNIDNDINVGSIRPGGNILVNFDVEVIRYTPSTEIINKAIVSYINGIDNIVVESNELKIPVININLALEKRVDKCKARIGEVITYSVLIRNNSNVDVNNVIFYDDLVSSVKLLPSTVLLNLEPQYLDSFSGGLNLGTINAYSSVIISFQVQIISLPDPKLIKNSARIEFNYTIVDNGILVTSSGETCSNEVITLIINGTLTC